MALRTVNSDRTCLHILETGKNKGNPCGKYSGLSDRWCSIHRDKNEAKEKAQYEKEEKEYLIKHGITRAEAKEKEMKLAYESQLKKEIELYGMPLIEHQKLLFEKEVAKQKEQEDLKLQKIKDTIAENLKNDPDWQVKKTMEAIDESDGLDIFFDDIEYIEESIGITVKDRVITMLDGRKFKLWLVELK